MTVTTITRPDIKSFISESAEDISLDCLIVSALPIVIKPLKYFRVSRAINSSS